MSKLVADAIMTFLESSVSGEKIPSLEAERMVIQLDELKKQILSRSTVTDADRERWRKDDQAKIYKHFHFEDGERAPCENCLSSMPGIVFPIASNGNEEHAWVECCMECGIFETDLEAALFVGTFLERDVRMGYHTPGYTARPYIVDLTIEQAQLAVTSFDEGHVFFLEDLKTRFKEKKHAPITQVPKQL